VAKNRRSRDEHGGQTSNGAERQRATPRSSVKEKEAKQDAGGENPRATLSEDCAPPRKQHEQERATREIAEQAKNRRTQGRRNNCEMRAVAQKEMSNYTTTVSTPGVMAGKNGKNDRKTVQAA